MSDTNQAIEATFAATGFDYPASINLAIEKGLPEVAMALNASRMAEIDRLARKAFYRSFMTFQSKIKSIQKSKTVSRGDGKGSYKYAPLDAIMDQCLPILTELGFSITTGTRVSESGNSVSVLAVLHHVDGHQSQPSEFMVPIDKQSRMNSIQQFGAARSYALRYALTNLLGITTSDEDNDGQSGYARPSPANRQSPPPASRPAPVQASNRSPSSAASAPAESKSVPANEKYVGRISAIELGEDFEARMKKAIDATNERFQNNVPTDVQDAIHNRVIASIAAIPADAELFGATRGAKKMAHNLFGDSLPETINAALKARFQEWDAMKKQPAAA
ncbi:MAG: ERF family protein [Acidiphilium sp.]|nr:ERF family protein [Acidiphilium sp.]